MKIYDLAGLPTGLRPQLAALGVCDNESPQDDRFLGRLRRLGYPTTDYWGVYAVEGDELLARVETLRLPFTGRTGTQPVVGVADVVTRPPGLGRGYARALLQEVHRRSRADGARWSFLWTRRSWGAHRLYESLGYQDIYSTPYALGRVPSSAARRPPGRYRLLVAGAADAGRIERILLSATHGRLGFLPRPPAQATLRARLGGRSWKNFRILFDGRRPVGYAYLSDDRPWNLTASEVVVPSPEHRPAMLAALRSLARGRWLTFQSTSFVTDAEVDLREGGFLVSPVSHAVLMAKPLVPARKLGEDLRPLGSDPAFSNHRGDMF